MKHYEQPDFEFINVGIDVLITSNPAEQNGKNSSIMGCEPDGEFEQG